MGKKRQLEINLANTCNSNPKKFFSYYKFNKKNSDRIGPIQLGDSLLTSNVDMANALSNRFAEITGKEDGVFNEEPVLNPLNIRPLLTINITVAKINKILNHLKATKTRGPDNIYARILREGQDALLKPLCIIFNESFRSSAIPTDWKRAHVTPIFKKGSKEDDGNYRPISLTSLVCKLLESIIKNEIQEHLESKTCSVILNMVLGKGSHA